MVGELTMDNIFQVSVIYIAGMITALILPNWLSFLFVVAYISYQLNIVNMLYQQVPVETRSRYKSKFIAILDWTCDMMRDPESTPRVIKRRTIHTISPNTE